MKRANVFMLLICLLFSFSTFNAWAAPPAHAKGTPPTKTYWLDVFGEAGVFSFPFADCGFPTQITLEIAGFWMVHPGHPTRDVWEFYHSAVASRITNMNDESIYVEGIPGQTLTRHWFDGGFQGNSTETGVQLMVTLPGYGVIIRDVGKIVYQWPAGPVEFQAGVWDTRDGDFQALCNALSG